MRSNIAQKRTPIIVRGDITQEGIPIVKDGLDGQVKRIIFFGEEERNNLKNFYRLPNLEEVREDGRVREGMLERGVRVWMCMEDIQMCMEDNWTCTEDEWRLMEHSPFFYLEQRVREQGKFDCDGVLAKGLLEGYRDEKLREIQDGIFRQRILYEGLREIGEFIPIGVSSSELYGGDLTFIERNFMLKKGLLEYYRDGKLQIRQKIESKVESLPTRASLSEIYENSVRRGLLKIHKDS